MIKQIKKINDNTFFKLDEWLIFFKKNQLYNIFIIIYLRRREHYVVVFYETAGAASPSLLRQAANRTRGWHAVLVPLLGRCVMSCGRAGSFALFAFFFF